MEFHLKSKQENIKVFSEVSKEDKERLESFGNVCIKADGKYIFMNPYDEYDRSRVTSMLGLQGYKWFKEDTGDGNWVIFNPYHYHIDKNWEQRKILRLNTAEYNGEALETPINASSLSAMFSWMAIPKNIKFSKRFDLSNIKDMSLMFAGTRISQETDIFESFSTDKVLNTRYMFYKAILPKGFNVSDYLNTKNVKNMEYMFSQAVISDDCVIDMNTKNTKDMNHIFFQTKFGKKVILGDVFQIRKDCITTNMLDECTVSDIQMQKGISFEEFKRMLLKEG